MSFLNKQDLLYISTIKHKGFKARIVQNIKTHKPAINYTNFNSMLQESATFVDYLKKIIPIPTLSALNYSLRELYFYLKYRKAALNRLLSLYGSSAQDAANGLADLFNTETISTYVPASYSGLTIYESIKTAIPTKLSGIALTARIAEVAKIHIDRILSAKSEIALLNKKAEKEFNARFAEYKVRRATATFYTKINYTDSDFPIHDIFIELYNSVFINKSDFDNTFFDLYSSANSAAFKCSCSSLPISYTSLADLKSTRMVLETLTAYELLGEKLTNLYSALLNWYLDLSIVIPAEDSNDSSCISYNTDL